MSALDFVAANCVDCGIRVRTEQNTIYRPESYPGA